jgi:lipoprotein-releasing system permease protein
MYKLLLTFRYLRRKLIPWFALLAVTLCTAMVIIVGSVMGGFLDLVRDAGKSVMGDVVVVGSVSGVPHYDEIITEIQKTPEARMATPLIVTYGLLKLPGDRINYVSAYGIRGREYAEVTDYGSTLYWNVERVKEELHMEVDPKKFDPHEAALDLSLATRESGDAPMPGMVPGLEISPYNYRRMDGSYAFSPSIIAMTADLTVMPIARGGTPVDPSVRRFAVVNEFLSGFFLVDSQRVYIPFDVAQKMMLMDAATKVDPDDPTKVLGATPARCSEIHVAAADGIDSTTLKTAVQGAYARVVERHDDLPPMMSIVTWQENSRTYIQAIEHEKGLLTVLFGIISLVAVVMIAVIFYMIVLEKTRDIGILRSIGASRSGVAGIFLLYGLVIGVIGAALGLLLSLLIVHALNELHAWLGRGVGASAFAAAVIGLGLVIGGIPAVAWRRLSGRDVRNTLGDRSLHWLGTVALAMLVLGPVGMILGVCVDVITVRLLAIPWGLGDSAFAFLEGIRRFLLNAMRAYPQSIGLPTDVFAGMVGYTFALLLVVGLIWRRWARAAMLGGVVLAAVVAYLLLRFVPDLLDSRLDSMSLVIWDRSVYFFDRIPARIDTVELAVTLSVAVVASVAGALIPAIKAARLHPVESLRYE